MTGALVDDRAAADVERRGGHGAGVVRGGEGGHVADVVEGRRPLQHGVPLDVVHDRLAPIEALGEGLGHPAGPQGQHADAVRPELGGQIAAEGLHGAEGDLEPSQMVAGRRVGVAAALEVRNIVLTAVTTGRSKSSSRISASGVPWTSPCEMRLKEMSMPPASAATASACSSTALSSSASTRAVEATPPAERIVPATASRRSRVRPARWTFAPSRAKARATAAPIAPPPP